MTHWTERARCAGSPLAWWFPASKHDETPAFKICARCPVRQECLNDAIETGETMHGIRGGLTPAARIAYAKSRTINKNQKLCLHCETPLPPVRHWNAQVHDACRRDYKNARHLARNRARRERIRANRPPRECEVCQATLASRDPRARFCEPCARVRATAKQRRYAERRRANPITCEWCGKNAPLTQPMHDRCAAEKKTADALHRQLQETA